MVHLYDSIIGNQPLVSVKNYEGFEIFTLLASLQVSLPWFDGRHYAPESETLHDLLLTALAVQ